MSDLPVKSRGRPERKPAGRFHHGDLAAQALLEAERLVDEHGHSGFSMRRVADALGVTEPALYRHYSGREALLAHVAMRGYDRFTEVAEAAIRDAPDSMAAIEMFGRSYVRFAWLHRGWFRLTFSRETTESSVAQELMQTQMGRLGTLRATLLGHLSSVLPPGDDRAADLYRLVWGTAHGLAFLVVERVFQLVQTDEERIAAADDAIRLFIESLTARLSAGSAGG